MLKAKDSIQEGYEVTDMNTTVIIWFLVGLFAMLFGSVAVILMVLRGFESSRPALNSDTLSALATPEMQRPPMPHLQDDPVADRKAIKKALAVEANGFGMVSEEGGVAIVHIPVDRAMEIVASGDVPYRQTPKTALLPSAEQ